MGPKAGTLAIFLLGLALLSDAKPFLHSSLVSTTNIKTKISATLLLLGCISLYCLVKKRAASKQKDDGKDKIFQNPSTHEMGGKLVQFNGPFGEKLVNFDSRFVFTPDDLLCAMAEIMGESPYHTSYRATLEDGREVNVKRLRETQTKGVKEFEEEVMALGKIRHANLLSPRAYFLGPNEMVLIFDYMSKGSLSTFLHARGGPETLVPWATRMKIAKGISRGLAHLHSKENMIHENLNPNNIFLDGSNVCIDDYGLSRLMTSAAAENMIATAGAMGYQAPEVSEIKNASKKSDVYSLGVIILELLTGKYPGEPANEMGLPGWVASVLLEKTEEEEWAIDVFDLELMRETPPVEVSQLMDTLMLALHCVDPTPEARPEAIQVMNQLEEIRPEMDMRPFGSGGDGAKRSTIK